MTIFVFTIKLVYAESMNDTVSYSSALAFPNTKKDYALYDTIFAAIGDINFTLPAWQKIMLSIENLENTYYLQISQRSITLCQYEIERYPHIFRRIWTVITVGFVDGERVEEMKNTLTERFQLEPIII